jgi:acyl-CoA synthetase (AMP-forming)/AMP-acid ligase II
MAIIDFFDRGWQINPEGAAFICDDTRYSFQEVGALTCRIAHGLLGSGISRGGHAAIMAANHPTAWACTLGAWRAGLVWIPINPKNALDENLWVMENFDADVIFFQRMFAPVVASIQDRLPRVKLWICIDDEAPGAVSLEALTKDQPSTKPAVACDPADLVAIMPTGGTTGKPKGVMVTHRSVQTFVANYLMGITYPADTPPVNLAVAPMTHTAGVLSLPCSARGGTVVVLSKPDPALLLGAIAKHRITEFFLPPTVIYRLLEIPGIEKVDFSSLKYLMYGAAPMSVEKLKQAIGLFGPVLTGGYGQTEAPASISFLRPEEHFRGGSLADDLRLASVGRPAPMNTVAILDDENRPVDPGGSGEICVRGDLVMKGYYKAPEATAATLVDGWLHTGDIGHLDVEGYLHITDRKKDMIISGGFNVYPSEVEQVIWSHPAVSDCAVIGVPDADWGEAVKAVVELKPGQAASADELIALCKERLGSVKAPKSVDFIKALPRSANGKVLKKDLRAGYWAGQARAI